MVCDWNEKVESRMTNKFGTCGCEWASRRRSPVFNRGSALGATTMSSVLFLFSMSRLLDDNLFFYTAQAVAKALWGEQGE